MKKILLFLSLLTVGTLAYSATCTVSGSVTASATTCNTLTTGDTMLITGTLTLSANYSVQAGNDIVVIVDGGSISWTSNVDFNVGLNSVFHIINGGSVANGSGSCNASKRINFGGTVVVSCNGGGGTSVSSFTAFNAAGGGTVAGAFPVELIRFEATKKDKGTLLSWTTSSEYNNSHFEIQRSNDGLSFKTIGRMEGTQNSQTIKNYTFFDTFKARSILYYRLKQTDLDGTFTLSDAKQISPELNKVNSWVEVSPNPSNGLIHLNIDLEEASKFKVSILNMQGQRIDEFKSVTTVSGNNSFQLDMRQYPTGIYTLRIESGSKTSIQKISKR